MLLLVEPHYYMSNPSTNHTERKKTATSTTQSDDLPEQMQWFEKLKKAT